MKSVKQMLIDWEISFKRACNHYYNELTEEDIDFMVKEDPRNTAKDLSQHPFFNQKHVDYIVKKESRVAAGYLNKHPLLTQEHVDFLVENQPYFSAISLYESPFLNQKHIDYIVKNEPSAAATYLFHRLSEENIIWIAENHPEYLKKVFK